MWGGRPGEGPRSMDHPPVCLPRLLSFIHTHKPSPALLALSLSLVCVSVLLPICIYGVGGVQWWTASYLHHRGLFDFLTLIAFTSSWLRLFQVYKGLLLKSFLVSLTRTPAPYTFRATLPLVHSCSGLSSRAKGLLSANIIMTS